MQTRWKGKINERIEMNFKKLLYYHTQRSAIVKISIFKIQAYTACSWKTSQGFPRSLSQFFSCNIYSFDIFKYHVWIIYLLKSKYYCFYIKQLHLACDVCLCGYTDHGDYFLSQLTSKFSRKSRAFTLGHCGVLKSTTTGGSGFIDNEASIERIAQIAG